MDKQYILDNTIFLTKHGSHAYGLNTLESDLDIKGVVCVGPKYYLGFHKFEQFQDFEDDQVRYSLHKFIKLAGDCNPNIIEVLFTDNRDWLEITPVGEKLLINRDLFLSLKAKYTFTGYATSQLKKLKTKHRWLVNPPTHKPIQKDYYQEPSTEIEMGLVGKGMGFFNKQAYISGLQTWNNYLHWKNNRNPKRRELEEKYHYDSKHAMHLVRLLKMGWEIVSTGKVIVKRPDREELLAVRNGHYKYDELIEWANKKCKEIDELYDDYQKGIKKAPLPMKIQQDKLNELAIDLITMHWKNKGFITGDIINA